VLIAYLTTDEVNQDLATQMANDCGAALVVLTPKDPLPDGQFDAAIYDLDYAPAALRDEILERLTSGPNPFPIAVHGSDRLCQSPRGVAAERAYTGSGGSISTPERSATARLSGRSSGNQHADAKHEVLSATQPVVVDALTAAQALARLPRKDVNQSHGAITTAFFLQRCVVPLYRLCWAESAQVLPTQVVAENFLCRSETEDLPEKQDAGPSGKSPL
jgi:hypothetical protein